MAKASDLLRKLGSPAPLTSKPTVAHDAKTDHAKKGDDADNVTAQKPDRGHGTNRPGKAQGGAGAPGGRPKV